MTAHEFVKLQPGDLIRTDYIKVRVIRKTKYGFQVRVLSDEYDPERAGRLGKAISPIVWRRCK